jgi:tetratricopeptide (TPR) repeat protein
MRRTLAILCLLAGLATAPLTVRAQAGISPAQELFVQAFLSDRKADELVTAGDTKGALQNYRAAADALSQIKQQFPTWQKELVDFRLGRVTQSIAQLQAKPAMMQPGDAGPAVTPGKPGAPADDILPPISKGADVVLPPPGILDENPQPAPQPGGRRPAPIKNAAAPRGPKATPSDPVAEITEKIKGYEQAIAEKESTNVELVNTVKTLTLAESVARKEKEKALADRKEATDLLEVIKKEYHELKNKKDGNEDKVKELEVKVAKLAADKATAEAEVIAVEERNKQLLSRTRATIVRIKEAGPFQAQIKKLEGDLALEKAARTSLEEKLNGVTKERDDARLELVKMREANKDADKLMAENANLLKKIDETTKQIQQFKGDIPKKDAEIALLKKQVTDTQQALASSQEKNTALQTEIGDLRKKMDDYGKQLTQYKAEKAVSIEERRKLDEENKLLQGIVMRVLQEDANRAQRKKMVQKEMERLQIQSDVLLKQVSLLAEPVVKLTNAERRLFKKATLVMQSPNDIAGVLPDRPEGAPAPEPPAAPAPKAPPTSTEATAPAAPDVKPAPNIGTDPLPTPDTEKPAAPVAPAAEPKPNKSVKAVKPPKPMEVAKIDPTKTPELPTPDAPPAESGNLNNSSGGVQSLPPEVKPLAEQAKKAFESENYPEAEKIYQKAMLVAPNNLYVVSNLGVTQFRSKKYKQAEESFHRAITIAPEDSFSWCTLGIVQYSQDKFDEAVTSLTKSIAINSRNATAHNYLGITAAQKGWIEHARKELETAIQLNPKYEDAYFNLAVTYTLQKPANLDEARKAYKKAVEFGAEADPAMESTLSGEPPVEATPKGVGPAASR